VNKVETGQMSDVKNMSVKEYLNHWLEEYARKNVSHTTFKKYENAVEKAVPHIGYLKLINVKPVHVQKLFNDLSDLGLSSSSCATYFRALKTVFNMAVKWQIIYFNPFNSINSPKESNKKIDVLTQDEVNYLPKNSKDHPIYPVLLIVISCGLRRGEILGLQWSNINFLNSTIYVENNLTQSNSKIQLGETKTSAGKRAVSVPNSVLKELKEIRKKQKKNKLLLGKAYEDSDYVCTWQDGRIFRPDYITKVFPKILKELDLPIVRFHYLRHSHASLLLRQGIQTKVVQERLCHSNISITLDTYSHILPDMQK
jgi:integrase